MSDNSLAAVIVLSGLLCISFMVGSLCWRGAQTAVVLEEFREELHKHDLMLIDGRLQKFERNYRKVEE